MAKKRSTKARAKAAGGAKRTGKKLDKPGKRYQKPNASGMSNAAMERVIGGQTDTYAHCGKGSFATGYCVEGATPWLNRCMTGRGAMGWCIYGSLGRDHD